jgi:hypothetical protein
VNKLWIVLLLVFPHWLMAQEQLEFVGEQIDFSITPGLFSINGIYNFINSSGNEIHPAILFPFPDYADSVKVKRVYNLSYHENIPYQKVLKGIVFKFAVLPNDTVSIHIAYCQRTRRENMYILESTKTWKKPLQKALYSLTFDNAVTIDSLSIKPDTLIGHVYYWTRTNFYPGENFSIWIR